MSHVLYINDTRRDEILAEAAAKRMPVVLTRRRQEGWIVVKSRFCGRPGDEHRMFIAHPGDCPADEWPDLVRGELLGVAFRRGHKKCLFSALVTRECANAAGEPDNSVFEIEWPQEVQELQRRVYQRATPPPGREIKVGIQAVGEAAERETALEGKLDDVSVGGMRVRCRQRPKWECGQSVQVTFALSSRKKAMTIYGTYRHCEDVAGGGCSLGFQFVGLETTHEGNELLVRIARQVTDFHRAAQRRQGGRLRSRRHPR